jgi:hypothetical protein
MRYLPFIFALLALSLPPLSLAGNGELGVFEVHSRPAQDLLPALRQAVGEQGSVAAAGNRLIVRAPATRLEELRWLVRELDVPPRNLMIEARVDRHDYARDQHFSVGLEEQKTGTIGSFRLRERGTGGDYAQQRVRTLDGRAAFIRLRQSVPVYEVSESKGPRGETRQSYRIRHKDVTRGFYVLPRLHGENVTLELYQQDERQAPARPRHFDIQHASGVVSVRLGEWISLGSAHSKGKASRSGIGHAASTRTRDRRDISVRVTVID